jgi:hypothetical protein
MLAERFVSRVRVVAVVAATLSPYGTAAVVESISKLPSGQPVPPLVTVMIIEPFVPVGDVRV